MHPIVERLIIAESHKYANQLNISDEAIVNRIFNILKKTAYDYLGNRYLEMNYPLGIQFGDPLANGLLYMPDLINAFQHMLVEDALDLFETADLKSLVLKKLIFKN